MTNKTEAQNGSVPLETKTDKSSTLNLKEDPSISNDKLVTRMMIGPQLPSAMVVTHFGKNHFRDHLNLTVLLEVMGEQAGKVKAGDLSQVEAMLICQSTALDTMFAELARRAAVNMGDYLEASEKYMRLALKAQNQCRMTLETLANVKNPPVVYAKQANIANGPQQVNNTLHAHAAETKTTPSKLVESTNEQPMDVGTPRRAGHSNSPLEAMVALNRT